jgi:hypothetical protein
VCSNVHKKLPPKLIYNIVCHPLYSRYVLYYMLLKQHSYIGCEFFSTNFQTTAYKICARYVQISCNDVNEKWHQIPYITLKHYGAARYELHVTKICSMHIAVSRKCTQCISLNKNICYINFALCRCLTTIWNSLTLDFIFQRN